VLRATLHAVQVVIHVEKSDTSHHGEKNGAVHLTDGHAVKSHESDHTVLDEGECGKGGHFKTISERFGLRGGFG